MRRVIQLYVGLALYGFSAGLLVVAQLGLDPWDVFHQGVARQVGLSIGTIVVITSGAVLLLWIPLRQRPGLGTISNAVLVGIGIDLTVALMPETTALPVQVLYLAGGILLNGLATGLYIGADLGPGPRDGLMTGLARRGLSIRLVRTGIELTVLAAGWLLGGTVGVGTVAYAMAIGPLAHVTIPMFSTTRRAAEEVPPDAHASLP